MGTLGYFTWFKTNFNSEYKSKLVWCGETKWNSGSKLPGNKASETLIYQLIRVINRGFFYYKVRIIYQLKFRTRTFLWCCSPYLAFPFKFEFNQCILATDLLILRKFTHARFLWLRKRFFRQLKSCFVLPTRFFGLLKLSEAILRLTYTGASWNVNGPIIYSVFKLLIEEMSQMDLRKFARRNPALEMA